MAPMSPVPAARSVSPRMRNLSPAVNVRRLGRSDNSGLAAAGAGTTGGLPPSSVAAPAALASTTLLGMTTRQFSYALKSKLPGGLCLIIIGTEGTGRKPADAGSRLHGLHPSPGGDPHADQETTGRGTATGAAKSQPGAPLPPTADRACQQQCQALSRRQGPDPPVEAGRPGCRDGNLLCPA